MAATHPEITTSVQPAMLIEDDLVTSSTGRRVLAVTRLATGFIFLWAFLDKTFGLHYSTGAAVAEGDPSLSWINGGTPSQGFLTFAAQGPFKDFFNSISGVATDWLFMLGMLGVGVAVMLGIGLRVSAVCRLAHDGDDVARRVAADPGVDQPARRLPRHLRAGPDPQRGPAGRRHLGPRPPVGQAPDRAALGLAALIG